jgi:hypothetical protein
VDSDKNGTIDFEELKLALQKVKNENCSSFNYDEFEMKKLQVVGFISKFKSVQFDWILNLFLVLSFWDPKHTRSS